MSFWRAVVIAFAAFAGAGPCAAAEATSIVDQGRALYHGESPWSEAPRLPSGVSLPPKAAACARCHGARGEGRREGGATVPALRGRDPASTMNAAGQGRAADGRKLDAPMPRYAFDAEEAQALRAYLEHLGHEGEDAVAGVDARTVRWATLVPRSAAPRPAADAVRAMQSQFARVNAAGGAYGRELRLDVIEFDPGVQALPDALLHALEQGTVFGLVGSFVGDVPEAWVRELDRRSTPMLANLMPPARATTTSWVTHLLPSLHAQVQQAAAELAQRCGSEPMWLAKPASRHDEMAASLGVAAERVVFDAAPPPQARCVLSLLPPAAHARLRATLLSRRGPQGSRPGTPRGRPDAVTVVSVAMLSGPLEPSSGAPHAYADDTFVEISITPKLPPAALSEGTGAVWTALGDLAARIAVEATARSGRDLHPTALRRAVESMTGYEPLPGVTLQYSPQQRAGLALATHWRTSP